MSAPFVGVILCAQEHSALKICRDSQQINGVHRPYSVRYSQTSVILFDPDGIHKSLPQHNSAEPCKSCRRSVDERQYRLDLLYCFFLRFFCVLLTRLRQQNDSQSFPTLRNETYVIFFLVAEIKPAVIRDFMDDSQSKTQKGLGVKVAI